MLSRRRNDKPPDICDTHGISGNVFVNPPASSTSLDLGGFNPWIYKVTEDTSPHVTSERQIPDTAWDPRCQSGPSARNSFDPKEDFQRFMGPTNEICRFRNFTLKISQHQQHMLVVGQDSKLRFVFVHNFPTEAMLWIKEVELVESVDVLKSSSSTRGISMPNFEVLDARIASALNRIIHNSHFKRKISLEEQKAQKEDRFFRGRQIAYLIYDQFRVTGTHDSVENYTDLFTIRLRNDDIQEFDSKWDGILLSMTKIPSDDILEGLYKLRIRDSEKLKTVLELYDLEIHQKKGGPDYHRLKNDGKKKNRAEFTHQEAWLYVFEDNEAVIKMMIKGRSSTMRHVSRTHRVALDWLFDRGNLYTKIQNKYIDTKNQLTDILTKKISHVMSGIIC